MTVGTEKNLASDQIKEPVTNKIIVMCAGGTGGHIIPALAVAKALQNKDYAIYWLGSVGGMEQRLVPSAGFPINYIAIGGLRGRDWRTLIAAPFKMIIALFQAVRILRKIKPALVIGMGGFVTGPSGLASWLLRIPLIIHEQNAIPGTSNRILASFAQKVLQGFPHSFVNLRHSVFTGNPVREELVVLEPPEVRFAKKQSTTLKLLVVGGSRGALALNQCIPKAMQQLPAAHRACLEVWHQTGQDHVASTLALYKELGMQNKMVVPFIDNMAEAYRWADLVICRAGALTIAELAAVGIGSILVPFPFAIDDHQTKNAQYLSNAGAAITIQQKDLTPSKLASLMQEFITDVVEVRRAKIIAMAQTAYTLGNREALQKVVNECVI